MRTKGEVSIKNHTQEARLPHKIQRLTLKKHARTEMRLMRIRGKKSYGRFFRGKNQHIFLRP